MKKDDLDLRCSVEECNSCFHSLEEAKGHFYRESGVGHEAQNPFREITVKEVCKTLDTTIKRDVVSKGICFLDMLNAQTAEDQFNIMFSASSSTGKSYIPIELATYFPLEEIVTYSGASPSSFFHEKGVLVIDDGTRYSRLDDALEPLLDKLEKIKGLPRKERKERRAIELQQQISKLRSQSKILVDLEGKILIFLDQPNSQLLAKLRSFLSHDSRTIEVPITDKSGHGGLRTKHVLLRGYACVIFCTVSSAFDDQEANRNFILSPESEEGKISDALKLLDGKLSNREAFRRRIERDPLRRALILRILLIRASKLKRATIEEGKVLQRFLELHKHLSPRSTRDLQRIFALCYSHALLNSFNRESVDEETIAATNTDLEAAFELYEPIMRSNELGLSPETFSFYDEIMVPAFEEKSSFAEEEKKGPVAGLDYRELGRVSFERRHMVLSHEKIRSYVEALATAGLVSEEKDPEDRRKTVFRPIDPGDISERALRRQEEQKPKQHNQIDVGAQSGLRYSLDESRPNAGSPESVSL